MARKMKDSGLEWIGEIPEDWKIVKAKYIFKQRSTKGNSDNLTLLSPSQKYGVVPQELYEKLSGMNAVKLNQKTDLTKLKTIKIGDFCISLRSFQGGFEYSNYSGVVSPAYQVFYSFKESYDSYYKYLFKDKGFINKMNSYTMSLRDGKNISFNDFGDSFILYPSYKEQKLIADSLEMKIKQIEDVKNTILKEIQTLEDYKKSLITEAVTKGLDKNVEMKDSGIEWIGEIPKHWDLVKLKYEADKISKGISPKYVEEKMTPVVNQATYSKGFFDYNLKYCSDNPVGEGLLQKNDVLLATTGGGVLGKSFFFEENGKYLASTDVAFIRCKDKTIAKFIYYILSVNYELLNGIYAKGSTNQTHLQMNMLSNMQIPLPNKKEMTSIVLRLEKLCETINESISTKEKQLEFLEEYKKSLIYEYVTGKKEVL